MKLSFDLVVENQITLAGIPCKKQMRYGSNDSHNPAERRHQNSSLKIRERKHIERPADGQVPLQGEGQDGQHIGV